MSDSLKPLHLFTGYGIELEYMLVNRSHHGIMPICDKIIQAELGYIANEVEQGLIAWSNELCMHVIELKTNGPSTTLLGLEKSFHNQILKINKIADQWNTYIMPGAMHPWMDPIKETQIWPHEDQTIYQTFDKIFDCRGHGWSNLQSIHINLPFYDDTEFGKLHAAIRLALPLLPALAASSPIVENKINGVMDNRLMFYRDNARKLPSITGKIIPEPVFTKKDYENRLLQNIYHDLAPYDPKGILKFEWVNARGAITRFDRQTIEIRLLDIQECPSADIAIAAAVVAFVKTLVDDEWVTYKDQTLWETEQLYPILEACIVNGDKAVIEHQKYLSMFDFPGKKCQANEFWQHIIETTTGHSLAPHQPWQDFYKIYFQHGCLARRITSRVESYDNLAMMKTCYQALCHCAQSNAFFI